MIKRIVRFTDIDHPLTTSPFDFPWGVYAVKVEAIDYWVNEERTTGMGHDVYFPVSDATVLPVDHSSVGVEKIKAIIWPLPEYLAWQDDGGHAP